MPTSQPDFTIDDLAEMMALLDKDGNQDVSKEEFKEYCARAMGVAEDTFEKMWKLIDDNGDGILQFSELCSYFGVSVESAEEGAKAKKEMSDEDILAMLELSSKMYEEKEKLKVEENEKKKKALSKRVGSGARAGVTLIKKDNKDCKEYELLEACELLTKDDRDAAMALLGWKPPQEAGMLGTWEAPLVPSVRIEDFEKREMPLHKLARNHEHTLIKRLYDLVVEDAKGGKEIATSDINSQNKDGKTPLMLAVEGNVAYLNSIEGDAAKLAAYREKQVRRPPSGSPRRPSPRRPSPRPCRAAVPRRRAAPPVPRRPHAGAEPRLPPTPPPPCPPLPAHPSLPTPPPLR